MVDNPLKKIFLAFLSELDKEIKEKYPELSEDQPGCGRFLLPRVPDGKACLFL